MLTVTQLAKACNISRTTVLYYERVGLLQPANRSDNGYRWYGEKEVARLKSILSYRSFGLPVQEIGPMLERKKTVKQEQTLRNQFNALEQEIQTLRQQQKAILMVLEEPELLEKNQLTKARWVEIMRGAGFNEEDMTNWHKQFEKTEPDAHQEFLESLNIDADEIASIRRNSR
ncbi:MerR family transcriptional regulator [Photobacterium rosenbergii]|uniref:MerR family transcriptional regulator n=1 Tax=Photobacterium rosenbergii TaxID=294936 RepID=A0A2T3N6E8_9GAMM|nr:MerR family transcriptional regulator [Photobacterium rosenbergii]PSW08271.1 MerR family transcriptional regulator [Photobacterium rosenbergii]